MNSVDHASSLGFLIPTSEDEHSPSPLPPVPPLQVPDRPAKAMNARVIEIKKSAIKSNSAVAMLAWVGLWLWRVAFTIVATILTLGYAPYRMYKTLKQIDELQGELKRTLSSASLEALNEARVQFGEFPKSQHFNEPLSEIADALDDVTASPTERLEKFYKAFNAIVTSEKYALLGDDDPVVRLMERFSIALIEEVEGMEAYEAFAESILPADFEINSIQDITRVLREVLEDPKHLKRDSFLDKRIWEFYSSKNTDLIPEN